MNWNRLFKTHHRAMQQMRAESLPLHHAIEDALRDARCSMVSPLVAQQRVWGMCEDGLAGVVGWLPLPMLASCSLRVLQRRCNQLQFKFSRFQSGFNLDSIWIQSGFKASHFSTVFPLPALQIGYLRYVQPPKRHTFPLSFPSQLFK